MTKIKILLSSVVFSTLTFSAFASGLDLDLLYGSRYVALGGNHVTLTGDAYGPFYNPSAMSFANQRQLAVDFSPLVFSYEAPLTSDNNQRKSTVNIGPLFYLGSVHPLANDFTFGWALYPTALQGGKFENVDFGNGISGREYSNRLVRIELAPSIAYKFNENWSVGATWKLAYTQFDKKLGTFASGVGSTYIDNSLSAYDVNGFKFGALLHDWNGFSAGITYRTGISVELEGDTTGTYNGTLSSNNLVSETFPTEQNVDIPSQLQVGTQYEWIPKRFMTIFTYEWTNNSVLDYDAPIMYPTTEPLKTYIFTPSGARTLLNYKDGHAFHIGGEYTFHLPKGEKFRTGLGYVFDMAATSRGAPNPVLAPSNAYHGYALGGQYDWGSQVIGLALNYGEYHTNISQAELDPTMNNAQVKKALPGKYGLSVFFATLDYQYRF